MAMMPADRGQEQAAAILDALAHALDQQRDSASRRTARQIGQIRRRIMAEDGSSWHRMAAFEWSGQILGALRDKGIPSVADAGVPPAAGTSSQAAEPAADGPADEQTDEPADGPADEQVTELEWS